MIRHLASHIINEHSSRLLGLLGFFCLAGSVSVTSFGVMTTVANGHGGGQTKVDFDKVFVQHSLERPHLFDGKIREDDLKKALSDPSGKISSEFDVPREVRRAVMFWLRVYVEYSREQVVIFDERDPSTIYEVLDFGDLRAKYKSDLRYASKRRSKIWVTQRNYRQAFRNLKRRRGRARSKLERHIVRVLQKNNRRKNWTRLLEEIRFQTGQRDNVIGGIAIADRYFPWMEQIFKDTGVPWELTRLGLVESSFNQHAISHAGAKGVYQFMELTARRSFLLIDKKKKIDERLSPLKSAMAAARLLRGNKRVLKTWPLATIAYNAGMVQLFRIPRRIRRQNKIGRILDPLKNRYNLGYASRNYYPEFLAMLLAEQYREWFFDIPTIPPMEAVRYQALAKQISLTEFARKRGHGIRALQRLNPDVRDPSVQLPKGFRLALPGVKDLSTPPPVGDENVPVDVTEELQNWPPFGRMDESQEGVDSAS